MSDFLARIHAQQQNATCTGRHAVQWTDSSGSAAGDDAFRTVAGRAYSVRKVSSKKISLPAVIVVLSSRSPLVPAASIKRAAVDSSALSLPEAVSLPGALSGRAVGSGSFAVPASSKVMAMTWSKLGAAVISWMAKTHRAVRSTDTVDRRWRRRVWRDPTRRNTRFFRR